MGAAIVSFSTLKPGRNSATTLFFLSTQKPEITFSTLKPGRNSATCPGSAASDTTSGLSVPSSRVVTLQRGAASGGVSATQLSVPSSRVVTLQPGYNVSLFGCHGLSVPSCRVVTLQLSARHERNNHKRPFSTLMPGRNSATATRL